MQTRYRNLFTTIRTEGAILPPDLLQRIASGDSDLEGLTPDAYHLIKGERLNEATNRSWSRLQGAWSSFQSALAQLPVSDSGTTITRERWLLPLFQELGYGRLFTTRALEIDGKSYPISHLWQHTPIHLVGCQIDLDRRTPGVAGAARSSPHSLVQELLNRSDEHLWAFLSNGLRLRILRDNISLTRQAYVEFDLEAMMEGEVYADFVLFWLLCHQSRVEIPSSPLSPFEKGGLRGILQKGGRGDFCWLENWSRQAADQGTRALEQLRNGVQDAINALGRGFLLHPANVVLRENLRSGTLDKQDYYRQLLRLVYRLLFLFVAEDRNLLLDSNTAEATQERYTRFYSTARIRQLAERHKGTRHSDLIYALWLVMEKLGSDNGCPELGIPALGSFLFSKAAMPDLQGCEITNADLLDALRALAFITDGHTRRPVDYKNLRSEELGSVYEALLELHPELHVDAGTFELQTAGGHERKTTGSYYTPDSLVQCLLDSALEQTLDEAIKQKDPEAAILNLKICDPACGSGHFLIAAAHRVAHRLAAVRTGDDEPSPEAVRTALRDVIGHCIYGVDINPMAVELCKVSLWMEALETGKPLSFLEHRIQCGNSLLGTTPALLEDGIPDDAFKPIEGDDKTVVTELRKQNREERSGQLTAFATLLAESGVEYMGLSRRFASLDTIDDHSIVGIHRKEEHYQRLANSADYRTSKLLADAWCAAFVWKKTKHAPEPVTENIFRLLASDPAKVPASTRAEIQRLSEQYQFFHWHLAFPEVFRVPGKGEAPENEGMGLSGGFDVVLGNPPWKHTELKEKEWFSNKNPSIANAHNAAERKRLIKKLKEEDPELHAAFLQEKRLHTGTAHLRGNSGKYPLCGRGRINTYAIFAELNRSLMCKSGRAGFIIQSDIATADTYKYFFADLMQSEQLVSFYDFVNKEGIFPGIHRTHPHFCLITLTGSRSRKMSDFSFWNNNTGHLKEEDRHFTLTAHDLRLINPNTKNCPVFSSQRDAEIVKSTYWRVPVILNESEKQGNPWNISIGRMFNASDDAGLFLSSNGDVKDTLPLYESKVYWQYNHRYATYDMTDYRPVELIEAKNPSFFVKTEYVIPISIIPSKFLKKLANWFLSYRVITNTTNERTIACSILPKCGVLNSANLIFLNRGNFALALLSNLNSFVVDFICRQKLGGTNLHRYVMQQLPILTPAAVKESLLGDISCKEFIKPRSLELTYTTWDLESFASGYDGPPFRWDEERRFLIRCELDAAYFHLYGIERDDVDYIMETFPIVKRKDEEKYGEYRTKRVILDIYDAMAEAKRTGKPYQTIVSPPPAHPSVAHPPRREGD